MSEAKPAKTKKRSFSKRLLGFAPARWLIQAWLWLAVQFMFSFGPAFAYFWARRVGWLMWVLLGKQRYMALRNVDLCLPELSEVERTRVARKSFDHVAYTFFDMLLIPRVMGGERWKTYVEIGPDVLAYHVWSREGRGPLTISGHFGSWEIGAHVNSCHGMHQAALYRPPDLPMLDRWLRRMRACSNVDAIEKEGALRQLVRRAREKQPLLALLDQYGGDNGFEAPFFGIPTRWQADLLQLLLRHGLKLCVSDTYRHGDKFKFTYRALAQREFEPGTALQEVLRFYSDTLEKAIKERPEQYFWLHRRFKRRRDGGADRYENLGERVSGARRLALIGDRA